MRHATTNKAVTNSIKAALSILAIALLPTIASAVTAITGTLASDGSDFSASATP